MLCVGLRRIQTRGIASTHTHRRHVEVLVDDVRWAALADAAEDERHDDGEREDDECRLHTCPARRVTTQSDNNVKVISTW